MDRSLAAPKHVVSRSLGAFTLALFPAGGLVHHFAHAGITGAGRRRFLVTVRVARHRRRKRKTVVVEIVCGHVPLRLIERRDVRRYELGVPNELGESKIAIADELDRARSPSRGEQSEAESVTRRTKERLGHSERMRTPPPAPLSRARPLNRKGRGIDQGCKKTGTASSSTVSLPGSVVPAIRRSTATRTWHNAAASPQVFVLPDLRPTMRTKVTYEGAMTSWPPR